MCIRLLVPMPFIILQWEREWGKVKALIYILTLWDWIKLIYPFLLSSLMSQNLQPLFLLDFLLALSFFSFCLNELIMVLWRFVSSSFLSTAGATKSHWEKRDFFIVKSIYCCGIQQHSQGVQNIIFYVAMHYYYHGALSTYNFEWELREKISLFSSFVVCHHRNTTTFSCLLLILVVALCGSSRLL